MKKILMLNIANKKNNSNESLFRGIKKFFDKQACKKDKEYKDKISDLYQASYRWYLQRVLNKPKAGTIDFPDFLYLTRDVINTEANRLTNLAMAQALSYGKKHIEKCHRRLSKKQ